MDEKQYIFEQGFFGRLLALYSRNYYRVARLTTFLARTREQDIDSWWNCRNFVLNEDLSIDYDAGGLAVSATFLTDILVFIVLIGQVHLVMMTCRFPALLSVEYVSLL